MTVLATALSDSERGGTGRDEPQLLALTYGKGRVFHTFLGGTAESVECVGFQVTLQRGAEWAACDKSPSPTSGLEICSRWRSVYRASSAASRS